jgi:hypothetical protein
MHTANDREEFRDFEIGQVLRILKYSGDHVLLTEREKVLQIMIDRLTDFGRCCGMEINVKKL